VETDGVFETPEAASRPYKLEFIGDSITCGFGVETDGRGDVFDTALENSLLSYAMVAADLLGADCQFLCVSGIPLCRSANPDFKLMLPGGIDVPQMAMEDYYAYTDLHHQRASGVSEYELWDYARFVPDAIVINLGTNDAFRCKVSGNDPAEQSHFSDRYLAFLHTLRQANGNTPVLACTLGSMDYFLYDDILRAVERYRSETGDERVFCLKYGGMYLPEEGSGALGHPSQKTHRRMGEELAKALRTWLPLW
jgi:lysophospholipase L1-like esterase